MAGGVPRVAGRRRGARHPGPAARPAVPAAVARRLRRAAPIRPACCCVAGRVPVGRGSRRAVGVFRCRAARRRLRAPSHHAGRGHRGRRRAAARSRAGRAPRQAAPRRDHPGRGRAVHDPAAHGVRPGAPPGSGRRRGRGRSAGQPAPVPARAARWSSACATGAGAGSRRVPEVLALASPYSGSPMETRLRLLIVAAGLPPPRGAVGRAGRRHADRRLARPGLARAHDRHRVRGRGAHRARPGAARHRPHTRLVDRGWAIYRYTKLECTRSATESSRS